MKRRISLLLAVVMILGTFSFAFAADVNDKVDLVTKEGILRGDQGTNALRLDDPLARKEAVVLLSRLMDVEEEADNFEKEGLPTFADVQDAVYYKSFIAWAEDNKYFNGNPDGTFGFNDNLTVKEYAAVLLRALGYAEEVYNVEGWKNVEKLANDLNLLEDVETELNDDATRREVAVMTFNALGAKMKDSDKTLAEFLGIEMPVEKPQELKAEVKDTENLAEVVVELSNAELVKNVNELENPANYTINEKGVEVKSAKLDGDNVVLTLVPYGKVDDQGSFKTLVKGRDYKLTIRNVDPKINKTFNFTAGDNGIPVVEEVEFMGTHGIKVITSEPVDNPQERNFRVGDKRTSMIIEQYGRELVLTPYHRGSFDKDATELVAEGLVDFAGYKSVKTSEKMELATDKDAPKIKAAYRNGNKLTVVFEDDIYADSVEAKTSRLDLGNVSFVERRVTFYADNAEKVDTNVAVYTFEREIPKDVEVVVEGVQNHSLVTMERDTVVPKLFVDEYAPRVISALDTVIRATDANAKAEDEINGTSGLKIEFDKDIREFVDAKPEDINKDRHFTLYMLEVSSRGERDAKEVKVKVKEVKKDYIVLDFEDIRVNNRNRDYDYTLEVRNFTDLSGNRMEREYIDFQVLPKATAFNLKNERIESIDNVRDFNRDNVEITLAFNNYVDKASAEDASNYYIDGKLLVDDAIVDRDGLKVRLVIYDMTKAELLKDYKVLEISPRVKNLAKTATVANRFYELRTGEKVDDPKTTPETEIGKITVETKDGNATNPGADDVFTNPYGSFAVNLTYGQTDDGTVLRTNMLDSVVIEIFDADGKSIAVNKLQLDKGVGIGETAWNAEKISTSFNYKRTVAIDEYAWDESAYKGNEVPDKVVATYVYRGKTYTVEGDNLELQAPTGGYDPVVVELALLVKEAKTIKTDDVSTNLKLIELSEVADERDVRFFEAKGLHLGYDTTYEDPNLDKQRQLVGIYEKEADDSYKLLAGVLVKKGTVVVVD